MTAFIEEYNKRLNKKIEGFPGHFMSDTKWIKFFRVLSQNSDIVRKCLIKNVGDNLLRQINIEPLDKFEGTFHNKGIKDVTIGGPCDFSEIEWLVFPAQWTVERKARTEILEHFRYSQDLSQIIQILNEVGEFETEICKEKLIVYGYK